jgi:hypothetical protein
MQKGEKKLSHLRVAELFHRWNLGTSQGTRWLPGVMIQDTPHAALSAGHRLGLKPSNSYIDFVCTKIELSHFCAQQKW